MEDPEATMPQRLAQAALAGIGQGFEVEKLHGRLRRFYMPPLSGQP